MMLSLALLTGCREPQTPPQQEQEPPVQVPTSPTSCSEEEIPYDGLDNDCDSLTPDDDLDEDGRLSAEDCDDQDFALGGPEQFGDALDNDCDGAIDCDDSDLEGLTGQPVAKLTGQNAQDFCTGFCSRSVQGSVELQELPVADLTALSCLTEVGGNFLLYSNEELVSLAGLERLQRVGGTLTISNHGALASLEGLQSLEQVYDLEIVGNDQLTSLSGLQALTTLGQFGQMEITYNESLQSLEGLEGLTAIPGPLYLYENPSLQSLDGFDGLVSMGDVYITESPQLASIEALSGVEDFTGYAFSLADSPMLASLRGLEGMVRFDGRLGISGCDSLTSLEGLENLERVDSLELIDNASLASLEALANLQSVRGGSLTINKNPALTSLAGLDGLREIGWNLEIGTDLYYGPQGNPTLTDISALYGLEHVEQDVLVTGNDSLTDAAAQALVDQIEEIGGEVTIAGN